MNDSVVSSRRARLLSDVLLQMLGSFQGRSTVSLGDIVKALRARSFGLILLIFALPMALPVPVPPGINIMLALPLLLLLGQQASGRITPWFPQSWLAKAISYKSLDDALRPAIKFLIFLERFTRPRLRLLTRQQGRIAVGILGVILSLYICIPLPLTNSVPSMGIAIMALGLLMRDGLAVIAGALLGLVWISLLTGAILYWGPEGLDILKDFIKGALGL